MGIFAVVADDLTGAGDTGVQFSIQGFKTRIFLRQEDLEDTSDCDVVVLNTDSRALSPDHARSVLTSTARRLKRLGVSGIYKKIDSTFRGNVAEETEALMDEFGFDLAVIAPSFPANGRIVAGGYLLVNGEPVSRTAIGHDPVCPVTESFLPGLLGLRSTGPVGHLPLSTILQGAQAVTGSLMDCLRLGHRLVVVDAVSQLDLETLVRGAAEAAGSVLYVGSAGLASQVAKDMYTRQGARGKPAQVLVVCGSVNPRSREQTALLLSEPGWRGITIDPISYMKAEHKWEEELDSILTSVLRNEGDLQGLILSTPGQPSEVTQVKQAASAFGIGDSQVPAVVSEAIAKAAALALRKLNACGLVLTGGDTATAVTSYLGSRGIDLVSEVSPGIPIGRLVAGIYEGFPVITKAGGFGGNDALCQATKALRQVK